MDVQLPIHGIDTGNFAKHSVARMMITRRDMYHPRYGAPPLYYASCCDGFQDVFASDMAVYLEWGFFDTAKGVLDNYFTFYVRRNATVNYRGPELAQYGRTLTLIAQYYRLTGDTEPLLKHAPKIVDFSDMLISRRRFAQTLPLSDPSYGMIRGDDESDEMFSWVRQESELPHISFSLEAWRGFRDLGPVWVDVGTKYNRQDLVAVGQALLEETKPMMADIVHAMAKSVVVNASTADVCHPYVAGEPTCSDMDAAGAHVSNTSGSYNGRASEPWRSYSGMLYSGGLPKKIVAEIVAYNQNNSKLSHLGIWGGVGGFRNQ